MEKWEHLFCPPPLVFEDEVARSFHGKRVAVTGGGGFIGSELCRQLVSLGVSALLIFEIAENSSYELLQELKTLAPDCDIRVAIGSVRDRERIFAVFSEFCPHIVCHAAAHKHVPLMEDAPGEAVKNNVFGTENTADAAIMAGAERFMLISTDKAVAPKSVMGATKRLCERMMEEKNREGKTLFSSVRFGNVFASSGSVVPLFLKQIQRGGPVAVTHKDAARYFMTVSEAVFLVLQAISFQQGGEIFVLDMGKPFSVDALAKELVRRSGKEVDIVYTGLRPGEKLREELVLTDGELLPTAHSRIFKAKEKSMEPLQLQQLYGAKSEEIKKLLAVLLPEYDPQQ